MAEELKYRKYFLNELTPQEREKGFGKSPMFLIWTDDDIIKGSHCFSAMIMGQEAEKVAHGPHLHNDPEVLVALGTDPDNPGDLGATIELSMGPEMEVHTFNTSTLVYIPAKFIHCPFRVRDVKRPFIFIQAQYAPKMTETSFKKMIAEKERENMLFLNMDGNQ
jgi:hypothetical protein